jgi:hypothetical protein
MTVAAGAPQPSAERKFSGKEKPIEVRKSNVIAGKGNRASSLMMHMHNPLQLWQM